MSTKRTPEERRKESEDEIHLSPKQAVQRTDEPIPKDLVKFFKQAHAGCMFELEEAGILDQTIDQKGAIQVVEICHDGETKQIAILEETEARIHEIVILVHYYDELIQTIKSLATIGLDQAESRALRAIIFRAFMAGQLNSRVVARRSEEHALIGRERQEFNRHHNLNQMKKEQEIRAEYQEIEREQERVLNQNPDLRKPRKTRALREEIANRLGITRQTVVNRIKRFEDLPKNEK